jgi:2-phospho-L-lactate/phosphoenolpyruvate guanylyltransferase
MSVGVIIPFRGLGVGKTRLRAALPGAMVDILSERMLANVVRAVRGAVGDAPVVVITQTRAGLSLPARANVVVLEQPLGLNEAIEFARTDLLPRGVDRIAVVPSDLPLLQAVDVRALLAPSEDVIVAPDADDSGTNGLVFPVGEPCFSRFGAGSAQLHVTEAARRARTLAFVRAPALERDVDTAEQIDNAVLAACRMSRVDNPTGPGLGKALARQGA